MAETCVAFAAWMPYAMLAALGVGVLLGALLRLGIDRVELAAYRRIARLPIEEVADEHDRAVQIARRWRDRARRIAD